MKYYHKDKVCSECNRKYPEVRISLYKPTNQYLCDKHRYHINKYGEVREREPVGYKFTCSHCKKEFIRNRKGRKNCKYRFCSLECKSEFYKVEYKGIKQEGRPRSGEYRKCKECKKEFYICKSEVISRNTQFCSMKCFSNYRKKYPKKDKSKYVTYRCKVCGKEKTSLKTNYIERKNHYCSARCHHKDSKGGVVIIKRDAKRNISKRIRLKGKNHPCYKKESHVEYPCDNCGKIRSYKKQIFVRHKNHYCSHRCLIEHRIKEGLGAGKNNAAWKGGKSIEPYGLGFTKNLRRKIRDRDNHICQECHYTEKELGEKLSVHHIDYNKGNNSWNNLISLCRSCHAQTGFKRDDWQQYFTNKLSNSHEDIRV